MLGRERIKDFGDAKRDAWLCPYCLLWFYRWVGMRHLREDHGDADKALLEEAKQITPLRRAGQ